MKGLPDKNAVVGILDDLIAVIYPGYFGRVDLESIHRRLAREIERSAAYSQQTAEEEARCFLQKLPELQQRLSEDVKAAFEGDPAAKSVDEVILAYPGVFAVTTYRLAHELQLLGIPLMPRIMTEHAHSRTGIDIHPGAAIGSAFFIDHGTGVVIGETAEIGNHVKLYQGVTLGALSFERGQKRHPTIEDNVVIYAGATILGGNTVIGHDAVIGGNVWLTRSVPPYTRVRTYDSRDCEQVD